MDKPDILLIVLDTLRKDTLDFNELLKMNSEVFNEFTAYENCIATSPWTVPSHISLFTGRYPLEHGIHETKTYKLPKEFAPNKSFAEFKHETIFEYLKKNGYSNYGISTNVNVRPGTVFERGFDIFQYYEFPPSQIDYDNYLTALSDKLGAYSRKDIIFKLSKQGQFGQVLKLYKQKRETKTLSMALGYPLEKGATQILRLLQDSSFIRPFSIFLNIMEMHEPYPTPFSIYDLYKELISDDRMKASSLKKIKKEYLQESVKVKNFLLKLFTTLKKNGMWDNTLIIVTSDHGQAFWENGFGGHGTFLFDELVRVPLIIKYPNNPVGRSIYKLCTNSDIYNLIRNIQSDVSYEMPLAEVVFSESYGTLHDTEWFLRGIKKENTRRLSVAYDSLNIRRLAAFKDNQKICIDGENGAILEFMKNGKFVTPERKEIMDSGILDDILIFDQKAVVPFS